MSIARRRGAIPFSISLQSSKGRLTKLCSSVKTRMCWTFNQGPATTQPVSYPKCFQKHISDTVEGWTTILFVTSRTPYCLLFQKGNWSKTKYLPTCSMSSIRRSVYCSGKALCILVVVGFIQQQRGIQLSIFSAFSHHMTPIWKISVVFFLPRYPAL